MAQKYDLTDIGNALSRVMDNPMTKIIRSGSIGVLGVIGAEKDQKNDGRNRKDAGRCHDRLLF